MKPPDIKLKHRTMGLEEKAGAFTAAVGASK